MLKKILENKDMLKNGSEIVRLGGKNLEEFLFASMCTGIIIALSPYISPIIASSISNSEKNIKKQSLAESTGKYTGIVVGSILNLGQIYGYYTLTKENYPVLAFPLMTTFASGLYAINQAGYRRAKEKGLSDKQQHQKHQI